jgi:small subunit ribosomal protein S4
VSVNGRTVNVPSYQVRIGDIVQIRESLRGAPDLKASMEAGVAGVSWMTVAFDEFKASITALPQRDEIQVPIDEQIVMEFYSR